VDLTSAAEVLQRLLALGLTVRSWPAQGGYVVKVTGGKTPSEGVGASFFEAFQCATWRWTQHCLFRFPYRLYEVFRAVSVDRGLWSSSRLSAPRDTTDVQRHVPDIPASRVLLAQERARRVSP